MRKFLSFLLTLLLLFGIVGCKNNQKTQDVGSSTTSSAESSTAISSTESSSSSSTESSSATSSSTASSTESSSTTSSAESSTESAVIDENESYTSKDDVALYIHVYGHLPSNFITKKDAEKLGWSGGSLEPYAPGKCIGGDRFGNYEGLLPKKTGRSYTECDIDTLGKKSRGAKRIVFSNDGLIYYTDDHYASFALLYGEE